METETMLSLVEEVKSQWRRMWTERIDDRVHAEGIAGTDFDKLFVERGTVVLATRDFKLLSLKEIFEMHKIENVERHLPPSTYVGGWGRFARTLLPKYSGRGRRMRRFGLVETKKAQQLKKGGRGWLHV